MYYHDLVIYQATLPYFSPSLIIIYVHTFENVVEIVLISKLDVIVSNIDRDVIDCKIIFTIF